VRKLLLATLIGLAAVLALGGPSSAVSTDSLCEASAVSSVECQAVVEAVVLPSDPVPQATAPTPQVQAKQQLPITGSDTQSLAVLGSIFLAGGALLTWRSRGGAASEG
jgi:LPXTG-motif cell wall-anchored protein